MSTFIAVALAVLLLAVGFGGGYLVFHGDSGHESAARTSEPTLDIQNEPCPKGAV